LAVEADPFLAVMRLAEQLRRVDAPSARGMDGANQAFVTDGTPMGEAVDRLEMAGETELVALAAFSLREYLSRRRGGERSTMFTVPQQVCGFFVTGKRKASMPYDASG